MSYRAGRGIRENAARHAGNAFLLKTDFQRFFPSIKPEAFWQEVEQFSKEAWAAELLAERPVVEQLLFWRPARRMDGKRVLSIGAPSSPMVSNFCLQSFDEAVARFCSESGVTYTRYADDLTFSTNEAGRLGRVLAELKHCLRARWPFLVLNGAKTVFASRRTNRHVTGLVITNEGALSLGREKKRRIKALVHQAIAGRLDAEATAALVGWLHFATYAEPDFMTSLIKKYTLQRMAALRSGAIE